MVVQSRQVGSGYEKRNRNNGMRKALQHNYEISLRTRIFIILILLISFFRQWTVVDPLADFDSSIGSVKLNGFYNPVLWRFTFVDLTVGIIAFLVLFSNLFNRGRNFKFMLSGFVIPIALCGLVSFITAIKNNVATPMYGIRPVAIFCASCLIGAFIGRQKNGISVFIKYFVWVCIIVCAWYLSMFFAGKGDHTYFMRVPTYDGATLLILLFGNLLGMCALNSRILIFQMSRSVAWILFLFTTACIVLSFARAIWLGLVIQVIFLFMKFQSILGGIKRSPKIMRLILFLVVLWMFGELLFAPFIDLVISRFQSMFFFHSSSTSGLGASDNSDHLMDINLGLKQVRENWFWGDGVGSGFAVEGIGYKSFTVGLHNTPLTIWLWFGLFGLMLWLGYSYRLFQFADRDPYFPNFDSSNLQIVVLKILAIWWSTNVILGFFFSAWFLTLTQVAVFSGFVTGISAIRQRS
jgi:hypothetical protein